MKKSKTHQIMSPEALQLVAERFKLLGEPIRLRILLNLQAGEMSVGEIPRLSNLPNRMSASI
jgi:DNA-binding transcriptional ArsR family regulator